MAKYYNPQGKKRGSFTKLQTGGQASIEALRRQEEPQLRALRQQQQRQSEYDRDVIQGEDRKFNAEFWNRQELKKMEDDIWRHREKAERVRAEGEISALKGKAAEFGKTAEFWEKFSTTYSKQWAKLAQGIYDYVDEEDAKKNFFVQQQILKDSAFFDPANETKTKFTEAEQEVLSKVAALVTKGNLTEEDKKWIDENLAIFHSNAFTLQGKLVVSEEQNVKVRFAQLQELLDSQGLQLTKDNAQSVAMNLAYMVSKKAGITDLGLQSRLVRAYTKEANAKYISIFNNGRAYKSEDRFQRSVNDFANHLKGGGDISKMNTDFAAMIIDGLNVSNTDGNLINTDPKQALIASIPYLLEAGVPEDKIFEMLDMNTLVFKNGYGSELDKEATFGLGPTLKGSITWRQRYKGKGISTLVQDFETEILKWKKKQNQKFNTEQTYKDTQLTTEIDQGNRRYNEWQTNEDLKGLSKEEAEKKLGGPIIDLSDPATVSAYSQKINSGNFTEAKKLWSVLTGVAGNEEINRDILRGTLRSSLNDGNVAYAEHILSTGIFGGMETQELKKFRAGMYTGNDQLISDFQAGTLAGIFKYKERLSFAQGAINKIAKLNPDLIPSKDPSLAIAANLLVQSEKYHFFQNPEIRKIENYEDRMTAATEAAYADLYQNQGLFSRLAAGTQTGAEVPGVTFPFLTTEPGLWGQNYKDQFYNTQGKFESNVLDNVVPLVGGKHEPFWLDPTVINKWLPVDELFKYSRAVVKGQADTITYHPRIQQIAKKTGLSNSMVANLLLERMEYTERIPLSLPEVIDLNKLELEESLRERLINTKGGPEETIESRMVTSAPMPGVSKPNLKASKYYESQASNPTRRLYYSIMNYALKNSISLRGNEPLPNNSGKPVETNNVETNSKEDTKSSPRDEVRKLIGNRKSITGHEI